MLTDWLRTLFAHARQGIARVLAEPRRWRQRMERALAPLAQSRLGRSQIAVLAWQVSRGMVKGDSAQMAAGVAFYALFALFPLLLGTLAVLGIVLNHSQDAQQRFLELVTGHLPGSAQSVQLNLDEVVRQRGVLALGATAGLVGTANMLFGAIGRLVNEAWGVTQPRPSYLAMPLRWGLALAVAGLFLATTWASALVELLVQGVPDLPGRWLLLALGEVARRGLPWAASFLVFLLIYRFVPSPKACWRHVWPGAAVAAMLLEIGKGLFVWYLRDLAVYDRIYGPLTSAIVLLAWIYLSATILLLGAHISARWQELRLGGTSP
ncbi:MAG: YihY/virulence factor BrkB family protein [Dehalococcoidia bacterium]|nr:YihY/virulence factor BrkB family protein [Dehalococcoidia bacterium]MSQ16644.1 YihY/virulence factor BrkB family protein [Dehalococcoidia bacterium]